MNEHFRRELDRMLADAFCAPRMMQTSNVANTEQPTLTLDGLLYHWAVIQQDLEENPIAVAMRAEPGTIALIERHVPELKTIPRDPLDLLGMRMRIEEDLTLPPRTVEFIDSRGRIIKRAEIQL